MAKFKVLVAVTYHKELNIFAKDEDAAESKALELVSSWENLVDSEVIGIEEGE